MRARGNRTAVSFAMAGLLLTAAGCSGQPGTAQASVGSCAQFGMSAISHHVTVTALPPACQGLTAAQLDQAVGTALRSAGSGVQGKALRRQRIVQASQYLANMLVPIPAAHGVPPQPAQPAARLVGKAALGWAALGSWLATVALGLWLMARRTRRTRGTRGTLRGRRPGRLRRPPALNLAHLGLAVVSLLAWIAYLATAITGLAWAGAGLLPLVAGLGMALLFLTYVAGPAGRPAAQPLLAAQPLPADSAQTPDGQPQDKRAPVVIVGAHVILAVTTILFAVLAAIGTG
jgi:hypothetical protein